MLTEKETERLKYLLYISDEIINVYGKHLNHLSLNELEFWDYFIDEVDNLKVNNMKHEEQQAFIEAYDENVGMYSKMEVERIVEGYFNEEDVSDNEGFEHVLDCLMIWMKATVYQMKKEQTS